MSQWGQSQPGYQYPQQTGFLGQTQGFQQQGFPQGGLAPQPTGFPGQRPGFQQPQQTGFPGAGPGLLPQQTGFPGSFQQQQRPPIPPVPPLPPQFQQQPPPPPPGLLGVNQPSRFLSASPGLGGSGLAPQQTGFPGQGGGLQPLVAQVTGFVDPRIQMMSSTFLPANPAAPYNAGGAPQLLQPQQQLGGLSLQQSFQQHNQEIKGTAAPRVPWTLSKAEKKSYDQIFRAWDTSNSGFIDGTTAIEVFGQSGLDRNDLARIWTLADVDNRGKLSVAEFHVAMGLIYRKLNGNEIPDELPAELVPPSHRDLDSSVNFVRKLLENEPSRARSPSGIDTPVSRLPNRSLHSTSAPGAGGRQDATVYKHTDEEPTGGYYIPRSRHLDRSAVRASSERDSPSADLSDMKRQLEATARMLDRATEESTLRTAEDDALDLKRRRRLERELLDLMHERVPAVEKKQKREWDRSRDRRNETFGSSSYPRDERDRRNDRDDRDRSRDRDYRDNHSRDYDRDYSYRDRSRSREGPHDRDRPRSPPSVRSPPPPPPSPPPAPPAPAKSPAPNLKNMTPEERQRMAAMGLSTPSSTEDRLAREKKEAEEKARAAEEAAAERARQRDERLRNERGAGASAPASPAVATPTPPVASAHKVAPPPGPARSLVAPVPPKPGPSPAPPSQKEERLAQQEAAALKAKQERLEQEAKREEESRRSRTPAPVTPVPPTSSAPSAPPANNPFNRLMSGGPPVAPSPPATSGGNNPFFQPQPAGGHTAPAVPPVITSTHPAPPVIKTEDDSDDDLNSSRDTRDSGPPRPHTTPKPSTPTAPSAPTPPPPPPSAPPAPIASMAPIAPPAPPASMAPSRPAASAVAPSGDRSALLGAIQGGARLRKTVTNDRSASAISGRVIGDSAPPAHVNGAPRVPPSEPSHPEPGTNPSRQSVDWYMGLAADQGTHASREPSLPPMGEEDENQTHKEGNGHAAPLPDIQVAHADEGQPDQLEDVDRGVELRVRSLYSYEGQRVEDLTFAENLVIIAHPSKSGGDWWYGTIVNNGKAGFFPKTYVQALESIKAKGLYDYPGGSPDELPFAEGDTLTIVDRSDADWYKAEKDGVIFIVPAAYLEVEDAHTSPQQTISISSPSTTLSPFPGTEATPRPPEMQSSPSAQNYTDEADDESASDDSASEYHSFSDSDSQDDEAAMTEEERRLERETRALERQMVLEAAGIVVKQDTTRSPPPRPLRRRTVTARAKHRPAPAPPTAPTPLQEPDSDKSQLHTPTHAHLDDAYERYEAFKQHASRMSVSSVELFPPPSPVSIGSLPLAPSISRDSYGDKEKGKEGATSSSSYGSRITQLLGRSRTPIQDKESRSMPTISAPILSASSSGTGTDGTPIRENSPAFGSSWASLVDKSALVGLPDRERRRQEAIFELIATEGAYVRDLQLIVEIFYSSMLSILEPKAVTVIFANVEDILLTNTTFLSSLEERQRSCRLYVDNIGDILDKHLPNMSAYREYCVNQGNAIKVLRSLRDKNTEISMQRITRYPLLIKQILHYTEPDQDRASTEHALRTAEKILNNINEAIREQEGRDRLKNLSQDLWIGQGRLDLTAPTRHLGDRRLLREGTLNKAKSGRKLGAFLCSDILLLTDEHGKTLYRMPIPLSEIQVREAPGHRDDLSFQLSVAYPRGGDKIALRASSARECHLWMADIDMASRKCREAEKAAVVKARGT
ncbi:hypothetical protein BC834DRAFT_925418 [Gloeopeniophorella convolvens]|nr:hypothetical protein BC834DRAFT_925418 [Gloeopeniophorella convolvens]